MKDDLSILSSLGEEVEENEKKKAPETEKEPEPKEASSPGIEEVIADDAGQQDDLGSTFWQGEGLEDAIEGKEKKQGPPPEEGLKGKVSGFFDSLFGKKKEAPEEEEPLEGAGEDEEILEEEEDVRGSGAGLLGGRKLLFAVGGIFAVLIVIAGVAVMLFQQQQQSLQKVAGKVSRPAAVTGATRPPSGSVTAGPEKQHGTAGFLTQKKQQGSGVKKPSFSEKKVVAKEEKKEEGADKSFIADSKTQKEIKDIATIEKILAARATQSTPQASLVDVKQVGEDLISSVKPSAHALISQIVSRMVSIDPGTTISFEYLSKLSWEDLMKMQSLLAMAAKLEDLRKKIVSSRVEVLRKELQLVKDIQDLSQEKTPGLGGNIKVFGPSLNFEGGPASNSPNPAPSQPPVVESSTSREETGEVTDLSPSFQVRACSAGVVVLDDGSALRIGEEKDGYVFNGIKNGAAEFVSSTSSKNVYTFRCPVSMGVASLGY